MEESDNKEIIVRYVLQDSLSLLTRQIENAMREIEDYSCIRFESKNYDNGEFLRITSGEGCYFSPYDCFGRKPQTCQPTVSIGDGCRSRGTILHELLHAIGFQHEHQRPDRNAYVRINWENIDQGNSDQFQKLPKSDFVWSVDDFDFDFASVMLYGEHSFSKNDLPTMTRLDGQILIQRNQLSRMDKEKLGSLRSLISPTY